jgi:hypothetical protein
VTSRRCFLSLKKATGKPRGKEEKRQHESKEDKTEKAK